MQPAFSIKRVDAHLDLVVRELQALAVRLAQRVDWTLRDPTPRPTGLATFAPKGGVPITVV